MVLECTEEGCSAKFTRNYNLNRHIKKFHVGNLPVEKCFLCGQIFKTSEEFSKHFKRSHKPTRKFVLIESAFKKAILNYRYTFPDNSEVNFSQSQNGLKDLIQQTILLEAAKKQYAKFL